MSAPDLPLDQATPANGDGGTGTWSGAGLNDGHFDPGAQTQTLTYTFIEGFILQSMNQGTGLAMLEQHQKILAPVLVGDTIEAVVEVTAVRPTSKSGRAVVTSLITVTNQRGEPVMEYTAVRLLAGRNAA